MKNLKEIKIRNSKLKLVNYYYSSGDNLINNNLRYKIAISLDKKSVIPIKDMNSSGEYWFIENSKEFYKDNLQYDNVDFSELVNIIGCIASYFLRYNRNNLDVLEKLILATKDDTIISCFYNTYGKADMNNYITLLKTIASDNKYVPTPCVSKYKNIYSRGHSYSVYRLLHELSEDNASILVDPSLIGDYNVISKRKVDRRNNKIQTESWSKIYGLTKNKTRANISISYNAKTIVQIPNNPYNIMPGGREIDVKKSMCIIKDGRLNQDRIGIKASPKLIGKLKNLGIVEPIVFKDEFIVDLSKLPLISKKDIKLVSSYYMAKLEANYMIAKVIVEYLDLFYPEKTITNFSSIEEKQKDEFLRSLGIVGNLYIPSKTDLVETGSYNTIELVTTVSGIPSTAKDRYSLYKDYKNCSRRTRNPQINVILDSVDFTTDIDKLRTIWKEKLNKFAEDIRDRKFQIIMSKLTKFSDNVFIDEIVKTFTDLNTKAIFRISWKFNKKTINL